MSYILTVTLNPCIDKTIAFDGFSVGTLNRALSERSDVGGKGINVSKVLKNMEMRTVATGIVFGNVGRDILCRLDALGIEHDVIISDTAESRVNLKLLDRKTGDVTEIGGVGGEVDSKLLGIFTEKYVSLLEDASLVVLSGSTPRGIPSDVYATLTLLAKERGIKVILDADGELLKNGIKAAPYMIKPNIFEFERLVGHATASDSVYKEAKALLDGIEIIAVSMGKEGSVFVSKSEAIKVSAVKIEGGCATGAGDSMVAASAYATVKALPLSSLAKYASAAGSATASKEGTDVCGLHEIEEFLSKINTEHLIFSNI